MTKNTFIFSFKVCSRCSCSM